MAEEAKGLPAKFFVGNNKAPTEAEARKMAAALVDAIAAHRAEEARKQTTEE